MIGLLNLMEEQYFSIMSDTDTLLPYYRKQNVSLSLQVQFKFLIIWFKDNFKIVLAYLGSLKHL